MLRLKKAMAVVQYSILIGIVAIALTTMNMYMRRSIQAKVKDLSDALIGTEGVDFEWGLDYMDDTAFVRETKSEFQLSEHEQIGGSISRELHSEYELDSIQVVSSSGAAETTDGNLDIGGNAEDPYDTPIIPYGGGGSGSSNYTPTGPSGRDSAGGTINNIPTP